MTSDAAVQPVVATAKLCRTFGALRAVDEVDLRVLPGQVYGLVGPNGSGKTTMLNLVSGYLEPSAGEITFDGESISGQSYELARRGMRRTFQLIRLITTASARENVVAGLYAESPDRMLWNALIPFRDRGTKRRLLERADAALDRVGALEFADVATSELPFGIQRRVELARAIVSEPKLLLLDEPAAGISEGDTDALSTLIRAEAGRGCAVVLVDHHLRFVLDLCDRVAVMNFGEIIFDGTPDVVVDDPQVREAYIGA